MAQPANRSVPPLGVIRDVILPKGNTHFDGSRWRQDDLLPTTDGNSSALREKILGMVGSSIDVLLPLSFGRDQHLYHFTFAVDSVSQLRWQDYHPAIWLPTAPPIHTFRPTTPDLITAVVIAGGFLGFLRYILVAKQSPVSR